MSICSATKPAVENKWQPTLFLNSCLKQFGLLLSKSVRQTNRATNITMLGEGHLFINYPSHVYCSLKSKWQTFQTSGRGNLQKVNGRMWRPSFWFKSSLLAGHCNLREAGQMDHCFVNLLSVKKERVFEDSQSRVVVEFERPASILFSSEASTYRSPQGTCGKLKTCKVKTLAENYKNSCLKQEGPHSSKRFQCHHFTGK